MRYIKKKNILAPPHKIEKLPKKMKWTNLQVGPKWKSKATNTIKFQAENTNTYLHEDKNY